MVLFYFIKFLSYTNCRLIKQSESHDVIPHTLPVISCINVDFPVLHADAWPAHALVAHLSLWKSPLSPFLPDTSDSRALASNIRLRYFQFCHRIPSATAVTFSFVCISRGWHVFIAKCIFSIPWEFLAIA